MDKNKEFIYKYQINQNKSALELLNQVAQLILSNISFFAGCIKSEENTNIKMPVISNNQGDKEEMKFQGKTIFKNTKCNTWYTRYRENGKQYFISGKTQKEVLTKLKERLNYIKKEKRNIITLSDWYKQWLKLFKEDKVKESTIVDYEKSIKHIPKDVFNKDITKITSFQINNIINAISKKRTAQKVYELLNALYTKAKDYEIVPKNILDIIEKPKHIREHGIALNQKEQAKFIEECAKHIHGDIFLVILYQGLRIGECLGLTGNDIDLINNTLTINKAIDEKGRENTTKNNQSNRTMPIFTKTRELLKNYATFGEKRIFNFSYYIPQKKLKEIVKITGIRNISLHDLRHTFITNCKNKEIPEHIIQSWVGHIIGSSVTSKIYTHVNKDDTELYIAKFDT